MALHYVPRKPRAEQIRELEEEWESNPRWSSVKRGYTAADVVNLRGTIPHRSMLAAHGADKLWDFLQGDDFVNCLGAVTGGQAVQQVKAGIKAIYLSGWQVAADNNTSETMYPDQSLYAVNSVPSVVNRINNAFRRADEIQWATGEDHGIDFYAPIVADAEAGFGGLLNAFELMKAMIGAGAAGVHFEDQLASVKKCGHMGGKVLVPTVEAVQKLIAARLAADVCDVPTVLMARTDANAADMVTSDIDEWDKPFLTGERTPEGFYRTRNGLPQAISRGLAYAPYADLIWCETAVPDLDEAQAFADAIHEQYPDQMLAYNCSPSFNWKANLDDATIAKFPARTSGHGLQVPVHHLGRHPQHVVQHVRLEPRLCGSADVGLRGSAGEGVRRDQRRVLVRQPPAGGWNGLLRPGCGSHPGRAVVGHGADGLHRGSAVCSKLNCVRSLQQAELRLQRGGA